MRRTKPKAPDYQPKNVCKTQRARILKRLDAGDVITTAQLKSRYKCANAGATIAELKKMGWKIVNEGGGRGVPARYRIDWDQPIPEKYIQAS
jgi:hypothetical protein